MLEAAHKTAPISLTGLPQAAIAWRAAATLGAPHRKVAFTVPTGNFGDIFAGYVAQRMGLPVDRLVVATNVNDILARTLATGTYEVREVVATSSPSMDIQVSSNFERLLFEACGRDAAQVRGLMASLAQSGRFSISTPALGKIRELFAAGRADENETAAEIRTTLRETSRVIDPHTAVALASTAVRRRVRSACWRTAGLSRGVCSPVCSHTRRSASPRMPVTS